MTVQSGSIRSLLLEAGLWFVRSATEVPGVRRIGLIGSILTARLSPKDIDLVVQVADELDLAPLASLGRRLKGRLLSNGRGADVFLVDERGHYIGRTCRWVKCQPGVRVSCLALHCGQRPYVSDDFTVVRLDNAIVAEPPLEIWPVVVRRCTVPADVERMIGNLAKPPNSRLNLTVGPVTRLAKAARRAPVPPAG